MKHFLLWIMASAAFAEVRAGAAARNVTPDLQKHAPVYLAGFGNNRLATGVHDDLTVRCLAISTGGRPLVMCGVDSIGLFHEDTQKIRARVSADVVIGSLHDHEAPDTMGLWGPKPGVSGINEIYNQFVIDQSVEAANEALRTMKPARLRLGKIHTPELDTFIGDNRPPVRHDTEITVLQASDRKGKTIGTLFNWANHPETLADQNTLITADYSGYAYRKLEQLAGGTAVFINGAVGGMQSSLGARLKEPKTGEPIPDRSWRKAELIGERVGELAYEAVKTATSAPVSAVLFREELIRIPLANPGFRMAAAAGVFRGRKPFDKDAETRTPVGYIRMSRGKKPLLEIALVPGELYPELSVGGIERYPGADFPDAPLETPLKKMFRAPYQMLFGLANDEIGYIIPKAEWDNTAPWLQNAPKRWYGEVNSVGPEAAPRIAETMSRLAGWPR
jgi:hypothetical protein